MSVRDRIKNLERRSSTSSPAPRASESSISQAELDAIRTMRRETEPEEVRRASMPSRPDWLDAPLEAPQEEKKSSGSVSSLAAKFKQLPVFGLGKPPGPKLPKVEESSSASQASESKPSVSVDAAAASASSPAKPLGVPVGKLASPIATAGKPAPSSPPVVPPPTGNEDRPTVPSGMKRQPSYKNLTGKSDVKNKIKHLGAVLPVFGQPMPPKRSSMVEVSSSQLVSASPDRFSESAVSSERLSESDARMTRTTVSHARRAPRKKRPIGELGPVAAAITPIEPIPAVTEEAEKNAEKKAEEEEEKKPKQEEKNEEKEEKEEAKQEKKEEDTQEDKEKEQQEVKGEEVPKPMPESPAKSHEAAPENEANEANEANETNETPETKAEATQPEDEREVARPEDEKNAEQPEEATPNRSEEPEKEAATTSNAAEPEVTNGEPGAKLDAAPEEATTEEAKDA